MEGLFDFFLCKYFETIYNVHLLAMITFTKGEFKSIEICCSSKLESSIEFDFSVR